MTKKKNVRFVCANLLNTALGLARCVVNHCKCFYVTATAQLCAKPQRQMIQSNPAATVATNLELEAQRQRTAFIDSKSGSVGHSFVCGVLSSTRVSVSSLVTKRRIALGLNKENYSLN